MGLSLTRHHERSTDRDDILEQVQNCSQFCKFDDQTIKKQGFIECQLCTIYNIELGVRVKQKDNAQIPWVVQNFPGQYTRVGS